MVVIGIIILLASIGLSLILLKLIHHTNKKGHEKYILKSKKMREDDK